MKSANVGVGKVVSLFYTFMAASSDDVDIEDHVQIDAYYKRCMSAWHDFIAAARTVDLPYSEYIGLVECSYFEDCLAAALNRASDDPPAHMLPVL